MPQNGEAPSPARTIRTGAVLAVRLDPHGRARSRPHTGKVLRPLTRPAVSASVTLPTGPDGRTPGY